LAVARYAGILAGTATKNTTKDGSNDDDYEDGDTDFDPVAHAALLRRWLGSDVSSGFSIVGVA
jgi:hypothetical protein